MMNGTQQPPGGSPVTTPQYPGKVMGGPHAQQQQGNQRQVSGSARPHSVAFDGSTPMQVGCLYIISLVVWTMLTLAAGGIQPKRHSRQHATRTEAPASQLWQRGSEPLHPASNAATWVPATSATRHGLAAADADDAWRPARANAYQRRHGGTQPGASTRPVTSKHAQRHARTDDAAQPEQVWAG